MTGFTDTELDTTTEVLKALAHDVRLKLMRTLLESGEKSVSELEGLTGVNQPGLSQQLSVLRKAELVRTRRDAKLIYYSLSPEALQGPARLICALAGVAGTSPAPPKGDTARVRGSAAKFARML